MLKIIEYFAIVVLMVILIIAAGISSVTSIATISLIHHSASKGRNIEKELMNAANFIDIKIIGTGKIPSKNDFHEWCKNGSGCSVNLINPLKNNSEIKEIKEKFGDVPPNAYILSVWRGDSNEYYIQGKGSTVASAFDLYRSSMGIILGMELLFATLCWLALWGLWKRCTKDTQVKLL